MGTLQDLAVKTFAAMHVTCAYRPQYPDNCPDMAHTCEQRQTSFDTIGCTGMHHSFDTSRQNSKQARRSTAQQCQWGYGEGDVHTLETLRKPCTRPCWMKVSSSHCAQPTWQKRPQEVRLKGGPAMGHSTHAGGRCTLGPAPQDTAITTCCNCQSVGLCTSWTRECSRYF